MNTKKPHVLDYFNMHSHPFIPVKDEYVALMRTKKVWAIRLLNDDQVEVNYENDEGVSFDVFDKSHFIENVVIAKILLEYKFND